MSSDATWLRGLPPRLPVDSRSARAVTPIPTRCRFSCIAYLALAVPSVLKQDLQDEQDFQD